MKKTILILVLLLSACNKTTDPVESEDTSFTYNKYSVFTSSPWQATLVDRQGKTTTISGSASTEVFGKSITLRKIGAEGTTITVRKDIRREWTDGTWFDTVMGSSSITSTNEEIRL